MPVYKGDPTKDGRTYYFKVYKKDYKGVNRQYESKKYKDKKEAKEQERLFMIKNETYNRNNFRLIALDFFEDSEKIRKKSTTENYTHLYNKNIAPYFDKKDIESINVQEIKKWAEIMLKKGLSTKYLNNTYDVFNCIIKFAMKNYGLSTNYLEIYGRFKEKKDDVIKDEDKIRYITIDEFNKFIECVDNDLYKTFFYTAFYTGMRKGELYALNWNDIDFNNKEIKVNKTLYAKVKGQVKEDVLITSTKTNKNRTVKMSNTLYTILYNYKKEVMKYENFNNKWFVFGNSVYLSSTSVDRIKDEAFKLSGVHRITMHEFRHSHCTMCIQLYLEECKKNNQKVDMYQFLTRLSKRMGHTIDVMLRTYAHLFPTIQDDIVDLLDSI